MHATNVASHSVHVHIQNVEMKYLGQAFRVGRHPINFHSNGNMTGSFIRNCSIHNSFNRGINIDKSGYLDIRNNVLFNIKGSGVNLESGNEVDNIIKHNLVISAIASYHLQNEDRSPAGFRIANPQNTLENNIASGGTHIGFWLRFKSSNVLDLAMKINIRPDFLRLTRFERNEAHSNGMHGLLIYPDYNPYYYRNKESLSHFKSWNNQIGLKIEVIGTLYLRDIHLVNNEYSNAVLSDVRNSPSNTAVFYNSLLVAVDSDLNPHDHYVGTTGLLLPNNDGYTINNITFVGYNGSNTAIACGLSSSSSCTLFTHTTSNLTFENSPSRITLHSDELFHLIKDIDGSFCGTPKCTIITSSDILSSKCQLFQYSNGKVSFCTSNMHLMTLNTRLSISLRSKQIYLTSQYRNTCPYYDRYLTMIESGQHYQFRFDGSRPFTNKSYDGKIHSMEVY